jgi:excisionase family DNA binding protein
VSHTPVNVIPVDEILALLSQDRYLSLSETSDYINLSERIIRERLSEIPHFRVGSKLLFKKSELDEWMLRYREENEESEIGSIVDEVVGSVLAPGK